MLNSPTIHGRGGRFGCWSGRRLRLMRHVVWICPWCFPQELLPCRAKSVERGWVVFFARVNKLLLACTTILLHEISPLPKVNVHTSSPVPR